MNQLTVGVDAWQELVDLAGPMVGLDAPYLVQGAPKFVQDFPSSSSILRELARTRIPAGAIEITTADKVVQPVDSYIVDRRGEDDSILIDLHRVQSLLRSGATIFLSQLDVSLPSLAAPAECSLPSGYVAVQIFAFITSPGTQSYSVHHDLLDSLIVQLEGSKSWRAWARSKGVRPGDGYVLYKEQGLGEADVEGELTTGDIVLLPANAPHVAGTTVDPSFHLAVAFRQSDSS